MPETRNRPGDDSGAASQQVGETEATLSAGVTLRAADALLGDQQTFTREQVAYLLHLAYEAGRTAQYVGDLAELHATWARHPTQRTTAEQQYRERMAQMEARGGDYRGGPVDFETGKPEPYSSPQNGTTLGVVERDVLGRWAA